MGEESLEYLQLLKDDCDLFYLACMPSFFFFFNLGLSSKDCFNGCESSNSYSLNKTLKLLVGTQWFYEKLI